jgi:hypothetical protein
VGSYGERKVMLDGDKLVYQRGDRPGQPMIALGGHRFAFEQDPGTVVEFAPGRGSGGGDGGRNRRRAAGEPLRAQRGGGGFGAAGAVR